MPVFLAFNLAHRLLAFHRENTVINDNDNNSNNNNTNTNNTNTNTNDKKTNYKIRPIYN